MTIRGHAGRHRPRPRPSMHSTDRLWPARPASSIRVEAAKVIENTQRDANIALINELALIFGRRVSIPRKS